MQSPEFWIIPEEKAEKIKDYLEKKTAYFDRTAEFIKEKFGMETDKIYSGLEWSPKVYIDIKELQKTQPYLRKASSKSNNLTVKTSHPMGRKLLKEYHKLIKPLNFKPGLFDTNEIIFGKAFAPTNTEVFFLDHKMVLFTKNPNNLDLAEYGLIKANVSILDPTEDDTIHITDLPNCTDCGQPLTSENRASKKDIILYHNTCLTCYTKQREKIKRLDHEREEMFKPLECPLCHQTKIDEVVWNLGDKKAKAIPPIEFQEYNVFLKWKEGQTKEVL